jgi:nicotinamidase/pyrazinamidase
MIDKIDKETDAILVVDLQNDFITGSLAVPGAEDILPKVIEYVEQFSHRFFSADFHSEDHSSFVEQDGPWPPHCIAGTNGSSFHKVLGPYVGQLILKGTNPKFDAYSAFSGTDLAEQLKDKGIKRLFVCGLATDYCVKASALDARVLFDGDVFVLTDAIAAVNVNEGDGDAAIAEMLMEGALPIKSKA